MIKYQSSDTTCVPVYSWIPMSELNESCRAQVWGCASHPRAFHHVAVMPDAHQGYGMPIGGVVALRGAVSPAMVGVDIGCGVSLTRFNIRTDTRWFVDKGRGFLNHVANQVTRMVPMGVGREHNRPVPWTGWERYLNAIRMNVGDDHLPEILRKGRRSLGTLGSGNHFIEFQSGSDNHLYAMVHTGSRGLGYQIANHYIRVAAQDSDDPPGIESLSVDSDEGRRYLRDMAFACQFAAKNRAIITQHILRAAFQAIPLSLLGTFGEPVTHDVIHNYASREYHYGEHVWVHRKGATAAREGILCIIPGSIGHPSFLAHGAGSTESFRSCSHGAGRLLGRNQAIRTLNHNEEIIAIQGRQHGGMKDVSRGKLKGMPDLSEAPGAYKDINQVMRRQVDLVWPACRLHPLLNIKG